MEKEALRQKAITDLKEISSDEKEIIEKKLTENVINSNLWKNSKIIGLTLSQNFEWDTKELIKIAWRHGKQVALPKCFPEEKELNFYIVNSFDQLENVYMHLLEPKNIESQKIDKNDIDALVVPGILFDSNGYRIGFGGGYYDRFLTDFENKKFSLCINCQIVNELPIDVFDIPVDFLVTETGIININLNRSNV